MEAWLIAQGSQVEPKSQYGGINKMDNFSAIGIAEGFIEEADEALVLQAWQHLVNTGLAWQLQGWFGRTAQQLIEQGLIEPTTSGGD